MATKAEVEFWKDQCRQLSKALDNSREDKLALTARIMDNSEDAKTAKALADGLEWQVSELKAENARLREQIMWLKKGDILHVITEQEYIDQQRHEREIQASIVALVDENAKLRELAADIWPFAKEWLSLMPQFGIADTESYDLYMRMRELGVEVDR